MQESSPCFPHSSARLWFTSCQTVAFLFLGCRQLLKQQDPTLFFYPWFRLWKVWPFSPAQWYKCTLCLSAWHRLWGQGVADHGAAGVSSANENHLASAQVRWKPDGRSQEGALGSLEQRPRGMSSPAFTCHLLRCPDSSRIQGFPLRPWPSERRWPQNLERWHASQIWRKKRSNRWLSGHQSGNFNCDGEGRW